MDTKDSGSLAFYWHVGWHEWGWDGQEPLPRPMEKEPTRKETNTLRE